MGRSFDVEMSLISEIYDPDGSKLLRAMDEARISKAVIFLASDYDLLEGAGQAEMSIQERNLKCYQLAAEHSNRLFPFFSIDPRGMNAAKLFFDWPAPIDWSAPGLVPVSVR